MKAVKLALRQIAWEQRMFWRNPPAAVFTFVFPLIFLVIFSAINADDLTGPDGREIKFTQYYVPAIVVFGLISACYTALAFTMCIRRCQGILKRKRGTPLSTTVYLGGVIGNVLLIAALLCIVTMLAGSLFYGFEFPDPPSRLPKLVLILAVAAFCFSGLGVLISTVVPNEDAAPAIINVILFPLVFISGTFGEIAETSILTKIAKFFPVWHAIHATTQMLNPLNDGGIDGTNLAVMAMWGVAAALLATRRFRWDADPVAFAGSTGATGRGRRRR